MSEQARPPTEVSAHYDAAYFAWQQEGGQVGGWANVYKYRNIVTPSARVLDFGCGGGFLLANLECLGRFGIEPNPEARKVARENGVKVFANAAEALAELGPGTIDVIISDNALEHALEPYRELLALKPLLIDGGLIHLIVPCESVSCKYRVDDINQHLYSWSPGNLGNLVKAAGYQVAYSRPDIRKWPPRIARTVARIGRPAFNFVSRIWGRIDRRSFQVELLARKPHSNA